ncbi:hypothetical protein SO802_030019 [Lithocarpus litseifolius]|uniref:Uncharacterized protein n=1 Tax=Lithocarpus litseifolius TaxID=425828 RepID=A0AAW2BUR9_9ROSI
MAKRQEQAMSLLGMEIVDRQKGLVRKSAINIRQKGSTKKNLIKVVTENYQTQFTQLDNLDVEFRFIQLQNRPKYEHKDIRKGMETVDRQKGFGFNG